MPLGANQGGNWHWRSEPRNLGLAKAPLLVRSFKLNNDGGIVGSNISTLVTNTSAHRDEQVSASLGDGDAKEKQFPDRICKNSFIINPQAE